MAIFLVGKKELVYETLQKSDPRYYTSKAEISVSTEADAQPIRYKQHIHKGINQFLTVLYQLMKTTRSK